MNLRDKILIEAFCQKLRSQGLARKTADERRENLHFFANSFLDASEGMELMEVDSDTMNYFLASWYPTKVKASRAELARLISSFKKFYAFIHQLNLISLEARDEILAVLARKKYYLARLQTRRRAGPEKTSRDAEHNGLTRLPNAPFWVDNQLYLLVHNLQKPAARISLDFQLFLDYLLHHPVRLSPSRAGLTRKDLHRMNRMFSAPEQLPANPAQSQSQRLSLFYQLGRCLDLFIVGPDLELMLTPRAELFLELNPDQKLVVLIDALWNRLRWSELENFGGRGFSGWAQDNRGGFAELLSRLPADSPAPLVGPLAQDRFSRMLANYLNLFELVENRIMFALKEMGMADYEFKSGRDHYSIRSHRGIAFITLTKFGKKIMKYLARKAREEMGGNSLIELMEDGWAFL